MNPEQSGARGIRAQSRAILGAARLYLRGWLLADEQARATLRWRRDRGDLTLRLQYPLRAGDVVFDLGGYVGDFAAAIDQRYEVAVYLFEPVGRFFAACEDRFAKRPSIRCFNYGLSSSTQTVQISLDGDASSVTRQITDQSESIELHAIDDFLDEFSIDEIGLLKINIEGGEFDVLEHLISGGGIARVRHLQVQFHSFARDAFARRERIRAALRKTHQLDWDYHFVWESWSRK